MGFFKGLLRYGFIVGLASIVTYNMHDEIHAQQMNNKYRGIEASAGYVQKKDSLDLKIDYNKGESGLETYLDYKSEKIPILQKENGIQIGSDQYVLSNLLDGNKNLGDIEQAITSSLSDKEHYDFTYKLAGDLSEDNQKKMMVELSKKVTKDKLEEIRDSFKSFYEHTVKDWFNGD